MITGSFIQYSTVSNLTFNSSQNREERTTRKRPVEIAYLAGRFSILPQAILF
jgi:hypothetical protein